MQSVAGGDQGRAHYIVSIEPNVLTFTDRRKHRRLARDQALNHRVRQIVFALDDESHLKTGIALMKHAAQIVRKIEVQPLAGNADQHVRCPLP